MDEDEWELLAKEEGVRLPPYGVPCTTAKMRSWLRRLGIEEKQYLSYQGAGLDGNMSKARLTDFIVRNPDYPLKAYVGLVLEARRDGRL
jgi:hypothetical protein